ncbi:hypothetical protein [Haladaptatus sp. NG-WS-4]
MTERGENWRRERGTTRHGTNSRRRKNATRQLVVLGLVAFLSLGVVAGVLFGAGATTTSIAAGDCSQGEENVVWHIERYGGGCQDDGFIRYPEGEQIDQVGEPPWAPL